MSKVKAGEAYVSITCDNSKLKSGLNVAKKSIDSFGKNSTISVAVSAVGIGYCMKQLAELQDQMLTLQGVTGKTQTEMKGLETQAKRLGATTSWTAGQVAEGMVALARLGQTCEQISASIEPVMNLAKGLGVSVSEAADMVGASLSQFKMGAEKASKVADVLAKATNSAAMSNTELATSLKYAGTSGAQMGQSLEAVTALVMQLRNLGYDAQQAGTIVRGFFLDLQDPKKARAFESIFNVNLKDAAGNFRPILAVLDEASKKAQEMGSSLVENLRKIEFTKANVGGIAELLNSTASLRRFNDTLKDSAGYANQLAKTMDSGTSGSIKLMKSAVDGLAITVGQAFEKDFVTAVKAVTNLADTANNFVKRNERLIVGLGKTASTVGLLASALVLAKKFGGGLLGMVTGLASALTGMASAAGRFLGRGQGSNITTGGGGVALSGITKGSHEASIALAATKQALATTSAELNRVETEAFKAARGMRQATDAYNKAAKMGDKLGMQRAAVAASDFSKQLMIQNKQTLALQDSHDALEKKLTAQEKQLQKNSSAWGTVKKAMSGVASAMTSMLLFTTIATAVKDVFDWLSKSASKMKQQADDAERFRDAMRDAYSQNNTVEGQKAQVSNIEETLANRFKYKDLSEKEKAQNDAALLKMKQQGILSEEQYTQLTGGGVISAEDQAFIRQSVLTNNFNRANNAGQKNADTMYNSTQQEIATKLGFLNTSEAERDAISSMMKKYEGLGGAEYAKKHGVQAMLDQMNLTEAEANAFNKFNEASAKMNPTASSKDVSADTLTRMSVYSILAEQNRLGYNNAVNLAQDATLTDAERSAKFAESIRDANSTFAMARGTAEGFGATSWYNPLKSSAIAIQDAVDFAKSSFAEVAKMPLDLAASNEYQRTVLAEFNKPAELPAMPAGLPIPDDTEPKPTVQPSQPTVDPLTGEEAKDAQDAAKAAKDAAEAAEQAMNAVFADSQDYNKSFEEMRKEAEEDWNKRLSEAMKAFDVNANRANARAVLRLVREGKREGYDTSDILHNNMQDRKRNREDLRDLFKKLQVNVSSQSRVMDSFTGTHTAGPQVNLQQQSLAKMNQFVAETQQQIRLLQQQLAQQNQIIRILQ